MSRHSHKSSGATSPALTKTYSPYGFCGDVLASLIGLNGERFEPGVGAYLLGNGYRVFAPALMRFYSPDTQSPFRKGGVNAYAYCLGDPINLKDPTGHVADGALLKRLVNRVPGMMDRASKIPLQESRRKSQSMQSLVSRRLENAPPDGWEIIGYHGGLAEAADSFAVGINPRLVGTTYGQKFGEGFYFTPSVKLASVYAEDVARINKLQPQLYQVYAPSFDHLRLGRDYSVEMQGKLPSLHLEDMEFLIRPAGYSKIEIRMAELRRGAVRPRSLEAPF